MVGEQTLSLASRAVIGAATQTSVFFFRTGRALVEVLFLAIIIVGMQQAILAYDTGQWRVCIIQNGNCIIVDPVLSILRP